MGDLIEVFACKSCHREFVNMRLHLAFHFRVGPSECPGNHRKLEVRSRSEAVYEALQQGIVEVESDSVS